MKKALLVLACLLLCTGPALARQAVTIEATPPVVVATSPQAGDARVDPKLSEIKVTFSKDMLTERMWSWVRLGKESFPHLTGDPHYLADRRTCVLPVRLAPAKTYALWINYGEHNHFRDKGQRPALPYLLVFKTAQ